MIQFIQEDKCVEVDEIESLMDSYDKNGVFATRSHYQKSFYVHFIRLINEGHVMTFRNKEGVLKGFCSWVIVDKKSKKEINKIKWLLPDNINEGNIMYIPACLTTERKMMRTIKESLSRRFGDIVDEAAWFNVDRGKFFHKKIKGGIKCLNVAG